MLRKLERGTGKWERVSRRIADILIAVTALILLSPAIAVIVIAIKLTSEGPALFVQRRVGRDREPFALYKFRTMRVGGDDSVHREMIARELSGEDTSNG